MRQLKLCTLAAACDSNNNLFCNSRVRVPFYKGSFDPLDADVCVYKGDCHFQFSPDADTSVNGGGDE